MQKRGRKSTELYGLLVLLVLLASCSAPGSNPGPKTTGGNYHVGTQGLQLQFMANAPPSVIYSTDAGALNVIARVHNLGAFDIQPNDLRIGLSGYDDTIIQGMQLDTVGYSFMSGATSTLYGKSEIYPEGGKDLIAWRPASINFPGDTYPTVFQATACYAYETQASPVVCIDPDPFGAIQQDEVCAMQDVGLAGGQGGPVAITRVEPKVIPNRGQVIFKIYLANVGSGSLLSAPEIAGDVLDACVNKALRYPHFDRVLVRASLGDGQAMTCEPQQVIMSNGQGFTHCSAFLRQSGGTSNSFGGSLAAYNTQLDVRVRYAYETSIVQPVKIINTDIGTGLR